MSSHQGEDDSQPHLHMVPLSDLLAATFGHHQHDHEQMHMTELATNQRIANFLDSADIETLFVLRLILAQAQDRMAVYTRLDGQIVALLRAVHHVDPDTGQGVSDLMPADGNSPPAG